MATVPVGYVQLSTVAPQLVVLVRFGMEPPRITQLAGGWEEVPRPKRKAITRFAGSSPLILTLSLMFDGYAAGSSQEDECRALERMATPLRPGVEPPLVKVDGTVPYKDKRWVINSIEWGAMIRSAAGQRLRAEATVELLEYVADDRVQFKKAAALARDDDALERAKNAVRSANTTKRRTYSIKQDDDLEVVAARELGDHRRWASIGDLNDIRDPKSVREGQVIILP
jgi:nucleoid-associated protein YgaU